MSKSYKRGYRLCQLLCDVVAVGVACRLAVWAGGERALGATAEFDWLVLLWLGVATWRNLYCAPIRTELWTGLRRAAETTVWVCTIVATFVVFSGKSDPALVRSFLAPFAACCFAISVCSRIAAHRLAKLVVARYFSADAVAVVGTSAMAGSVARQMDGTGVRGIIVPSGQRVDGDESVIGTMHELPALVNQNRLERLIIVHAGLTEGDIAQCLEVARRMGVQVSLVVCPFAMAVPVRLSVDDGLSVVDVDYVPLRGWRQFVKRSLDFAVAAAALLTFAPVMLLIAAAIKVTSKGPALYCAQRVGRGGRYFTFLKFRSMYVGMTRAAVVAGNQKEGHIFKMESDPRITPLGRVLRKYSLDELPQLLNVLCGDMSLVGPRPLPAEDLGPDGMSRKYIVWSRQRSQLRPGLTGLWQVRGRSALGFDEMVRFDVEYVHKWSLGLDMVILLQTPWRVISGAGAY